jgi:hypothetical protein
MKSSGAAPQRRRADIHDGGIGITTPTTANAIATTVAPPRGGI